VTQTHDAGPVPAWVPKGLRDALQLLRLDWPPTGETLVVAWRQRALETHPDRGGDHRAFVSVQAAYEAVREALKWGLPKAPSGGGWHEDDDEDDEHDSYAAAAYAAFRRGMRRSRKGNLWRPWGDRTVTVFAKRGGYHFCISIDDDPHWSRWAGYPSEEAACQALWGALQ
jgi:hypothetical protein